MSLIPNLPNPNCSTRDLGIVLLFVLKLLRDVTEARQVVSEMIRALVQLECSSV